jgi:hypothetical protein
MGPGRRYYYQRERVNGRIVYTYYGTGATADLIAACDRLDQQHRALERIEAQAVRTEFAKLAVTPVDVTALLERA